MVEYFGNFWSWTESSVKKSSNLGGFRFRNVADIGPRWKIDGYRVSAVFIVRLSNEPYRYAHTGFSLDNGPSPLEGRTSHHEVEVVSWSVSILLGLFFFLRNPLGFGLDPVWPENSIYLKQREIIPGVVDNETTRCQSAWTRSASC